MNSSDNPKVGWPSFMRKYAFIFVFLFSTFESMALCNNLPYPDTIFDPSEAVISTNSASTDQPSSRFSSGIVTTDILGLGDNARGINLGWQTNSGSNVENLYIVGHANNGSALSLGIAKYSFDGALDTGFSTTGVLTRAPTAQDNLVHGATNYSPLYFVGRAGTTPVKQLIGRAHTIGIDTTFNTSGVLLQNLTGQTEILRAVGKGLGSGIYASGYAWTGARYDMLVTAYNANATINTAFNTTGWGTIAMSGSDSGALALSSNVIAGSPLMSPVFAGPVYNGINWDFGVARLTTDGAMDTSFNTVGTKVFGVLSGNDKPYAVLQEQNAPLLVSGFAHNGSNNDFAVVRLLSDGRFDTSFNTSGSVTTSFFTGSDVAVAVNRNNWSGKISYVGSTDNGSSLDIAIACYLTNGVLDTSFHTDGRATWDIAGGTDLGKGIRLTNYSHAIFVAAEAQNSTADFALLRLETDGSLARSSDPQISIGSGGRITFNVSGNDSVFLTGAYTQPVAAFGLGVSGSHFFVAHMGASHIANPGYGGRGLFLSTSFNTTGYAELNAGGGAENLRGVSSNIGFGQPMTLVGDNGSDWLIARTISNSNTMNTTFNTSGWKTLNFSGNDIAYGVSSVFGTNILVTGRDGATPSNTLVVNLQTDGSLDTSFFTSGSRTLSPTVNSSAGKFVEAFTVSGITRGIVAGNDTQDLFIYMMTPGNGNLNTSFNTSGLKVIDMGSNEILGAVLPSQTTDLHLAGGNGSDFIIAKVTQSNGNLDTSFNTTGKLTIDFGTTAEMAKGIQAERISLIGSKLYVAGDDGTNFLLARLLPNGNLDTSFNTNGKRAYPLTGASTLNNLFINNNVDICMAGSTNANSDAVILCVNP